MQLETTLARHKSQGRKILVGYVTGGLNEHWQHTAKALIDGGFDAIEVGIPFSDPVMDGPVIQEASKRALERGTTPRSILEELVDNQIGAPLAVMTYFNLIYRYGLSEFATACEAAGVSGAILPDLSLEAAGQWRNAASEHGVAPIFLAAPNSTEKRLQAVCDASKGFVYAVGSLGVTGVRTQLSESAKQIGDRARRVTRTPVLIGVGVSNPEQAAQACEHADGVVVGTAIVHKMLEGASDAEMTEFARSFRQSLEAVS